MRVLFSGSTHFSLPSLEALVSTSDVVAVLTREDKPAGRHKQLHATPVKLYAQSVGIPCITPEKLDSHCREQIARYTPECMICAAYGKFFGEKFLSLFPKGSVNIHPSLLPRHRGATPILAALLANDASTGVSVQKIAAAMDEGDIILQSTRNIRPDHTYHSLTEELASDSAQLVKQLIPRYDTCYALAQQQNAQNATYTLKYNSRYGFLQGWESAEQIVLLSRAYVQPLSGVKVHFKSAVVKIWRAVLVPEKARIACTHTSSDSAPGTVLGVHNDYGIIVSTVRGSFAIQELQLEHRKKLKWKEFIQGNKDIIGVKIY
ncbi:methionyl-tRNA formyltransferase-like [Ylistrum balloti]|uniref:methionyl-tRNA formyltransferase-like n=1 Tax=Ylistrum balloti TaxID=509963 RepID=UPI0029059769|nr:methionyl-tRNA formyltransferase-like [Ylistrum balloti]